MDPAPNCFPLKLGGKMTALLVAVATFIWPTFHQGTIFHVSFTH